MNASDQMPGCERKFAALDLKQVDETGGFAGYASLFNERDMGGDIVMPGAFAKTLKKRCAGSVRMLFQHDAHEPVGVWREIFEDRQGLFVRGQLSLDVLRAREIHALMREGALDGLSIGFRAIKAQKGKGVRRLLEVDLWEISIVTFPMQQGARIREVKDTPPTKREFERWLVRDAGFTRSQARTVISSGYNLAVKQDAAGTDPRLVSVIRRATRAITQ